MMATGTPASNIKAFVRNGPIRWLVIGGACLIAAITIGTTIMAGNFRERALTSRERELENTVLLLARHFDQHLNDFTIVEKDLAAQIQSTGSTSETLKRKLATLEWHEVLKTKVGAYSDVAGINVFDAEGKLINSSETWPVPEITIADRAFFKAFKSGTTTSPILMELVEGRFAEGWATVIAHKVVGQKGEFIGIVTRAIAPSSFERFFASMALGDGAAITMYLRDGTLLARYPHVRADDRSELQDRSNSPPDIVEVGPWDDAFVQPDGRPGPAGGSARADPFPDFDYCNHDRRGGAGRLAGANQISDRGSRSVRDVDSGVVVSRRAKTVAATSDGKAAPRHRYQQHDAGLAAVRRIAAAGRLQPALYRDVRLVGGGPEARLHFPRGHCASQGHRIIRRRPRRILRAVSCARSG